eukprot:CAMPEP_0119299544 /NCGR_PEP_ID=MMETSP1333-20130426/1624_1 /TAXON_ID=418940 /ORGANISM="Scyphosphaera apsteinii, Strain RCC1455" /LENGTH=338 /DNA_ID=CAMNT_0007301007 /DNA_START=48 /DNA_END=1066 /DNA_ORIENTATION=+
MAWRLAYARASHVAAAAHPDEMTPSNSLAGNCNQCSWHVQCDDDSGERKAVHAAAREAFWAERDATTCWSVPMGRDEYMMPWLGLRESGLSEAIARARQRGRTVLLVDNSAHKVIDTFYQHRCAQVIEAKKMVMDVSTGARSHQAVMDEARAKLVNAMRYGHTMYFRLSNTACPFSNKFSSPTQLPLALFDQQVVADLFDRYCAEDSNLFGADHALAQVLLESDTEDGIFRPRRGFEVVLCTHFGLDDYEHFLARCLPMNKLQAIRPVSSNGGNHPTAGMEMDSLQVVDDEWRGRNYWTGEYLIQEMRVYDDDGEPSMDLVWVVLQKGPWKLQSGAFI